MTVLLAKNMTVVKDKYGVFKLVLYGGGFAQYTYLPEVNVIKIPDNLSFQDAAAISMVGMTSWHMLVTRANIQPGQTVLIMGGGSGMGIAGIQIAKLFNCDVIATAGTQDKMDKCIKLGADHVQKYFLFYLMIKGYCTIGTSLIIKS